VREDLRDLSRIQLISHVEQLVELLDDGAGEPCLSIAARGPAGRDGFRAPVVSYLERLYYIYLLRPFAGRLASNLRREPKVFLWDWSAVSQPGARLENLIAKPLAEMVPVHPGLGPPAVGSPFRA